jgi:amino acid adenylation domain-containing protein
MSETNTSRIPNLIAEIQSSLHELSGMETSQMEPSASFLELGFDSLFLSQAIIRFNQKFKLDMGFRVLFEEAPTIEGLAEYVDGLVPSGMFAPVTQPLTPKGEPLIVVPSQFAQTQNVAFQQPVMAQPDLTNLQNLSNPNPTNTPVLQQIINQQLHLMQQQLALLQGQPLAQTRPTQQESGGDLKSPPDLAAPPSTVHRPPSAEQTQEIEIQRNTKGVTAKLNSYKKISTGDDLTEKQRQGLHDFMRRYEAMTPKSKAMAQRHRQYYADPRSVTGFSKLWKEVCYQIAHEKSKGAHIWDVDGNQYVDYVMSYGVALFGHMPDFVEKAVAAAIQRGNSIDLLPPEATEVARMICEMTGFDRVTLANTGTEAVLGAVRAARTATGREKIAVFDTDYHGMIDEFMVRGVHFKEETKSLPSSPGVPKYNVENVLVLDYDDPLVLQKLERHAGELAAVLIEPVQAQNPHWQHGDLIRQIRRLTENHGVALIFDEIINGFRLDQRGAQAWYGVDADLCAYGKSISGGFPLAAVAGKAKFMNSFDGGYWSYGDDSSPEGVIAYFASTFIKNPISVAAAHAALQEIQRLGPDLQRGLNAKTQQFAERIREIFLRKKAPLMIQSASSFFMIKNADASPLTRLFNYVLRTKGVNIRERPCFISTAHTEADFERTYQGFEDAIDEMMALGLMEVWEGEELSVIITSPLEQLSESSKLSQCCSNGDAPTTEGQQEIFLSDQFSPEASKAYNIATEIRLEGDFDEGKMRAALQALVDRHEALRTVFAADGKTMRVLPDLVVEVPFVDLTDAPERILALHNEEAEHLFDLQNGPLVRFKIVRMEERVHLVFINVHHIICDGWSLGILTRELGELYGNVVGNPSFRQSEYGNVVGNPSFRQSETGVSDYKHLRQSETGVSDYKQLSQFATEQADLQRLPVFEKNEKYWLSQFSDSIPVLDLPTDFPRPPVKTFNGAVEKISFDAEFTAQIRKAAAKQGSTFYVFMLAAYQAYLSRLTGQDDFVVGVAAAGHNLPGNAKLVAHAISLLPVRTKVDAGGEFKDYLKQVRKQVLDAFDHQQYTFGALVKKLKIGRNASRNTLVSVAFNLDSPLDDLHFGNLKATTRAIPRHYETFDTFINLKPLGATVDFEWNFNTDLFRRESIRLRLAEFEVFLKNIVENSISNFQFPISGLPLLPVFEQKQLEVFGRGEVCGDFPLGDTLHGLFEKQVERTPDKIAVACSAEPQFGTGASAELGFGSTLTYRQLNDRANALAAHLIEKGLQPGSFVGVCMERGLEMMVSIYAILKAGGAYVPIDPRNPQERIRLILEDAGCGFVLTQKAVAHLLPDSSALKVVMDAKDLSGFENLTGLEAPPIVNPHLPDGQGQSSIVNAYVIYTSGSTGTPKGVVISHANAINTLFAINKQLKMNELDKVFSVSSMAFDMSIPDYFLTLMTGATLILAGEETKKDGFALRDALELHRPTVMQATPTTWKILLLAGWDGDKNLRAIAGGEAFSKDLAAEMMRRCAKVWNGYGPTETTIYATWQLITEEHLAACPGEFAAIGSPIANVEMWILDKNGEQVPVGAPGELFIGGNGVASGYLNRRELTTERFVNSKLKTQNSKLYKTGDLVRYLPTGEIEFLGRMDDQVKIRGYRVELGEIEETMKQFPGVEQSVVNVFNDVAGSQQLVGYVVENGQPLGEDWQEELKQFLRSKMPGYMVPSQFIKMDAFPQNTSLKVDRKALPKPDLNSLNTGRYEAPKTPGEKLLAEVWSELLGVEKVGVHDDFFELGGHSLAAVQMMTRVKEATGKKLPLTTLFQHSTIHKLAGQLNGFNQNGKGASNGVSVDNQGFTSLVPIREGGSKPALYLVHGGGLHVLFYQNMVKYMDADQPIYALQARGLDGKEEPFDRIEDMAAHYISEILRSNPEGPYCLAGYSLGGIVAWEMAKQLKEQGKEVLMLSLFDAVAKDEWSASGSQSGFSKKIKKAGYNLSLLFKNPVNAIEYKKHVLKMQFEHKKGRLLTAFRNNQTNEIEEGYIPFGSKVYEKSLEAYNHYMLQPLDIQVDLFKAKEQMFYLHDPVHYGWDKFALGGVVTHEIGGNHLTLFDEPHGKEVAAAMERRILEITNEIGIEI